MHASVVCVLIVVVALSWALEVSASAERRSRWKEIGFKRRGRAELRAESEREPAFEAHQDPAPDERMEERKQRIVNFDRVISKRKRQSNFELESKEDVVLKKSRRTVQIDLVHSFFSQSDGGRPPVSASRHPTVAEEQILSSFSSDASQSFHSHSSRSLVSALSMEGNPFALFSFFPLVALKSTRVSQEEVDWEKVQRDTINNLLEVISACHCPHLLLQMIRRKSSHPVFSQLQRSNQTLLGPIKNVPEVFNPNARQERFPPNIPLMFLFAWESILLFFQFIKVLKFICSQ
jgi:hypothetical protein